MDLKRCSNNHYYDGDRYTTCPHCENMNKTLKKTDEGEDEIIVGKEGSIAWNDIEPETGGIGQKNEVVSELTSGTKDTEPEKQTNEELIRTEPKLPDDGKTIGAFGDEGEEPVVGWLVCVEGEHRGESFTLKEGMNFVGRGINMDVPLVKDQGVSRDKHVTVVYDAKNIDFVIYMGASKELVYVNGEMLLEPKHLQDYDRISLGKTELLFVPFCCEKFHWDIL